MSMPKTSMNKYDGTVFGKDNVRFPWKAFVVDFIAESQMEKAFPYQQLYCRVFGMDFGHCAASGLSVLNRQGSSPS